MKCAILQVGQSLFDLVVIEILATVEIQSLKNSILHYDEIRLPDLL